MNDLQQAIKDSARHWYSNWALLSGKPKGVKIHEGLLTGVLYILYVYHKEVPAHADHCALCQYVQGECDNCPLLDCDSPDALYARFMLAQSTLNLPAMIRAARALYEKLDSLVEVEG